MNIVQSVLKLMQTSQLKSQQSQLKLKDVDLANTALGAYNLNAKST